MTPADKARARIRADAKAEGFGGIAFTSAAAEPSIAENLKSFLEAGFHGSMGWLAETEHRRNAPTNMWPEAKTAIVLAMNYAPDHNPLLNLNHKSCGNISVYARGRDYHKVMKGRLKQIAQRIASREGAAIKVFVDTAPLMEKPLAARAGLGWQGKHTNLVSRDFGSWLFLGVILTDADWGEPNTKADHCGSCRKCLDICPTNAFPNPYQIDAKRCISYLTIEHKGLIPLEFRKSIGNRIFGCDDCLAVCPWNRFAQEAAEAKLHAQPQSILPPLNDLLALDEDGFKAMFRATPVLRAGHSGFIRNVLIAAGNSGDKNLVPVIKPHLVSEVEVIKASAIWGAKQLLSEADFTALRQEYRRPTDSEAITAEWC